MLQQGQQAITINEMVVSCPAISSVMLE